MARGKSPSTPARKPKRKISVGSPATPRTTPRENADSPENDEQTPASAPPSRRRKLAHGSVSKSPTPSRRASKSREAESEVPCSEVGRVLETAEGFQAENGGENGKDKPFSQTYFEAKGKSSSKKSVKKVSDIDVVDEQEFKEALGRLVPKHRLEQAALLNSYKELYQHWLFQLKCGFGLLMYGFGSKRQLLEDFGSTTLTDGAVIVINGYLPTINMKQVLKVLKETLLKGKSSASSTTLDETLTLLINYQGNSVVYLLVHSIDGPALRDSSTQQLLAKLAACSHFHVVASLDSVNGPILWDKRMANTQFNWWWHHTPTYAPYTAEAAYVPLVLSSSRMQKTVRSATLVLQSLTPNAQSVFKVLADHQLANPEDEGLTQHQLYTKCRERFLVSSEVTLRAHLTEFKDHQLVRVRRGLDGQECLYITLSPDALGKLLEDLSQ